MIEWLKKYSDFAGRANRLELLIIFGICGLVQLAGNQMDVLDGQREVITARMGKWELASFVLILLPFVSVCVRRLHDTNRPSIWLLLFYLPYALWLSTENNPQGELFANGGVLIGALALFIFLIIPGDVDHNRYGQPPGRIF